MEREIGVGKEKKQAKRRTRVGGVGDAGCNGK